MILAVRLLCSVVLFMLAGFVFADSETNSVELNGEWKQGALITGTAPVGSDIQFLQHRVPQTPEGAFVLGLGRDAPETVDLKVTFANGDQWQQSFVVKQRDYRIQRVNGVPARTVNPDPKHMQRIRDESWLVKKAKRDVTYREDFLVEFVWPVLGPISGVYGSQRFYNGEPRRPHYGVDIAQPTGTPVKAPAGGKIVLAEEDLFFSGGTLIIDHGHGLSSSFLHLSKLLVKVGDDVQVGDFVGEIGATGRVTGPHLDWRMSWRDQRVDPQLLVPSMAEARKAAELAVQAN